MAAVSMGVAAAGAGASIAGQTQQNKAANQVEQRKQAAVDNQIEENRRRASEDYVASVQDEQLRQSQEHESLTEQELDLGRQERDAVSQSNVAAGEAGVAGQSLAAIQSDYRFQMDQTAGRFGINQSQADYTHSRRIDAYGREYTNRASSIQPYQQQPVKPVDYFSPIFGVLNAGIETATRTGMFRSVGQTNPLKVTPPTE